MNKVAEALIGDIPPATVDPVAAALTAYEPSWRERIGNSVYDAANYFGMGNIANRLRNDVETGIDFVPFVGDAIGLDDARNDFNAGNYGMAAAGLGLSAAGIVPGVGDAVAAGGRKILSAGAENARVVADMLASGRANEVTNDMISAADPSELWKLYESGATGVPMPMDQASRMARAREMGFDTGTPLYHGTTATFPAFDGRSYASSGFGTHMGATEAADAILRSRQPRRILASGGPEYVDESQVLPVFARTDGAVRVVDTETWDGDKVLGALAWSDDPNAVSLHDRAYARPDFPRFGDSTDKAQAVQREMSDSGIPGFVYRNDYEGGGDSYSILNPSDIRSRFARFDPRLKHLSHLSAGLAGAVAAGTISLEVANQMQELGQDYQP